MCEMNDLLKELSQRKSSEIVFNQYSDSNILNNLKVYFSYLLENNHNILIVGEAPGYLGCKLTGIPFTSGSIIKQSSNNIFKKITNKIFLEKIISENTATIIWDFFKEKNTVPILWNSFPFHPHKKGNEKSNRRPTRLEVDEGKKYLRLIFNLFNPKIIGSLGRVGESILKDTFPEKEIIYIRHPSHGGKNKFINGMQNIYDKYSLS